jgi:hypothetical protein
MSKDTHSPLDKDPIFDALERISQELGVVEDGSLAAYVVAGEEGENSLARWLGERGLSFDETQALMRSNVRSAALMMIAGMDIDKVIASISGGSFQIGVSCGEHLQQASQPNLRRLSYHQLEHLRERVDSEMVRREHNGDQS